MAVWRYRPGLVYYSQVTSVLYSGFGFAASVQITHTNDQRNPPKTLKLALVTETFPPEINGVAMTLSLLTEGLRERGHQVCLVRPRQATDRHPRKASPSSDILCPGLPIPGYWSMKIGLPDRWKLKRAWKTQRPDLVHVATEGPLGWAALSAAKSLGIPLSSSFHTNFHSYSRHYGLSWLTRPVLAYLRWFHNRTRVTLSPTADLNQQLTANGFKNVRLLSRGVNTHVFTPKLRDAALRASWGAGPSDPVVLHVSRVAAEKNFPLLLRAFELIRRHQPCARFVITSDGPLRRKLERRHGWITFTGTLERDALARHYASADLFLYPSLTETFGNVVLEAMASGLPVLAFDYAAAARYLRNEVNGLSVPVGNHQVFLDQALRLASDAGLRHRLGASASITASEASWDRVIDGFESDLLAIAKPMTGAPHS